MSKKTIRNVVISSIFLVLAIGGFVYTVFEVEDKAEVLNSQVEALAKKQAQETSRYRMQRVFDESANDREELKTYFFQKEGDSIDFLNMVESLAPRAGVVLETKNLEQSEDAKTKTNVVAIDFSFNGTYNDVTRFITILENLPYLSEITSLSLSARSSSNWEALVSMEINVYAYDE